MAIKWLVLALALLIHSSITGFDFSAKSFGIVCLGSREGDPTSVVKNVSVIHGDYSEIEVDLIVSAPDPLILSRYYGSRDLSFLANLGGWRFYSQCFLYLTKEGCSHLSENVYAYVGNSEGCILAYKSSKPLNSSTPTQFYPDIENQLQGLANTARGNITSWTNRKNNTLYFHPETDHFELFLCSGSKHIYVKSPNCYILEREILSSGNQIFYNYDEKARLKTITLVNSTAEKVLAWIKIRFDEFVYIEASDGQTVTYEFTNSLLSQAIRSHKPSVKYQYEVMDGSNLLTRKDLPDGQFVEINYYPDGVNKHKVQSIESPINEIDRAKIEFFYEGQVDGSGSTTVIDPIHRKTVYFYNNSFQLEAITDYLDQAPYRILRNTWGKSENSGNLAQTSIEDANGNTYYIKTIAYDQKGNILEEHEYGNFTEGKLEPILLDNSGIPLPSQPSYVKTYKYEKIREENLSEDIIYQNSKEGTGIRLIYYPNSLILKRKELINWNKIQKRYFYDYNSDGALASILVDNGPCLNDGETQKKQITRLTPNPDLPNVGAPQIIEEKSFDANSKSEILISKTINHFNAQGQVSTQDIYDTQNQLQYTLIYDYDAAGRLTLTINPLGISTYFSYDLNGNLIEKQEKEKTTTYTYDLQNNLISTIVTGEDGNVSKTQNFYDQQGNKILELDTLGNETSFKYDTLGRLITVTYPTISINQKQQFNPTYTYEYNFLDHLTRIIDPKRNETKTSCNVRGQLSQIEYPDGSQETFVYTLDGSLYQHTLPNKTTDVFEYDYLGHIRNIKSYPKNTRSSYFNCDHFHYTPLSLAFKRDQESTTQFVYDDIGHLTQTITSEDDSQVSWSGAKSRIKGGRKVDYEYDTLGRICTTKSWKDQNHFSLFKQEYNLLNQVIVETLEDEQGKLLLKEEYVYNELGRLIQVIGYPNNQKSVLEEYTYDSFDQITQVQKHGVNYAIEYQQKTDLFGQRARSTVKVDPTGCTHEKVYNHLGHLISQTRRNADQAILSEDAYFYDSTGHLTQECTALIANGKQQKKYIASYSYSSTGLLEATSYSSHSVEDLHRTFLYNTSNELIKENTPAFEIPITFQYDSNGRLFQVYYQEKPQAENTRYRFSYDDKGRIKEATSKTNPNLKWEFNNQNQILSETICDRFGSYSLSCQYDKEGCLTKIELPDHSTIEYIYEGPFVKKVIRYSKTHNELYSYEIFNRDLMGHILKEKLPGHAGIRDTQYDQYGRKTALVTDYFADEIPADGFDILGNITEKNTTQSQKNYKTNFHYSPLSELLSEQGIFNFTYEYDSIENRLSKNNIPYSVNDLNQISQYENTTYKYDANGNLASRMSPSKAASFEFDALGRITFTKNGCQEFSYSYDHLGRRLTKQTTFADASKKTLRHFYLNGYLLGSLNEQGEIVELYLPNNPNSFENVIVIELKNTPYAALTDLQDNVRCLVDLSTQEIVESYYFSAFGEEKILSHSCENPWRYQSQYHDEETGLIYFGKRYYDPQTGKWISPDPLGSIDSANLYSFCHNNPLKYRDIWGLFSIDQSCGCIHHNHPGYRNRSENCVCICGQHEGQLKLSGIIHGMVDFAHNTLEDFSTLAFYGGAYDLDTEMTFDERQHMIQLFEQAQENRLSQVESWVQNTLNIDHTDIDYRTYRQNTHLGLEVGSLVAGGYGLVKGAINFTKLARVPKAFKQIALPNTSKKIWTSTRKKSSIQNAFKHWKKHGAEFPELLNAKQYVEQAHNYLENISHLLTKVRPNGDVFIYDIKTNFFVVYTINGVPKTMFKPKTGIKYWKTKN
ncbi:MAG: hypothetical protein KDK59_08365 [Simkania sp.]|nr:hypothetical protein [Simkania sp.]